MKCAIICFILIFQLFSATTTASQTYISAGKLDQLESVGVGDDFIVYLREDRSLWISTDSFLYDSKNEPTPWATILLTDVKNYVVRGRFLAAVTESNKLYLYEHQSGTDFQQPQEFMDNVTKVAIGGDGIVSVNYLCLKTDHTLWAWGDNFNGMLGTGDVGCLQPEPVKIAENVSDISVDVEVSQYVDFDNVLYTCGSNEICQLFPDRNMKVVPVFTAVAENIKTSFAGSVLSCALKLDNQLICWGGPSLEKNIVSSGPITIANDVVYASSDETNYFILTHDRQLKAVRASDLTDINNLAVFNTIDTGIRSFTLAYENIYYIKSDGSLWIASIGSEKDYTKENILPLKRIVPGQQQPEQAQQTRELPSFSAEYILYILLTVMVIAVIVSVIIFRVKTKNV